MVNLAVAGGSPPLRSPSLTNHVVLMTTFHKSSRSSLGKQPTPRCEDCFFHQKMLCALDLDVPCATFRPAGPQGLVPPRQTTLLVRAEAVGDPEPQATPLAA